MNNLKLAFFTEAGSKRGMGHLIRCHTIYEEFKQANISVKFFLDSDINFDYKFNNLEYFKWEKFNLAKDEYDVVFIDSYEVNLDIYKEISSKVKLGVFIDDFGRLDYPQGLIINFAPDSEELFYKEKKQIHQYLLGLDFLPIREEFKKNKILKEEQIFIMLGGNDTKNLSFEVVKSIDKIDMKKVLVLNNEKMIEKFKKFKNLVILYKPSDSLLIENMKKSKVAISTASMSLYELAYLQVPTIIIAVSKNQEIGAKQSIKHNIASSLVNIKNTNWNNELNTNLNKLLQTNLSFNSNIDGFGTKRIYEKVIKLVEK